MAGHSLGGATANVFAKKLSDEFGSTNVFNYNFAPPRSIDQLTDTISGQYNNVFNIINIEDGMTYLPPLDILFDRYGQDIRFHRALSPRFYGFFEMLVGRAFNKADSAHDTAVYMSFILSNRIDGRVRVLRCACPIDIEIYDSTQILVGSVKENRIESVDTEQIYIHLEGDEKYIYLLTDKDYTLKIAGTDNGTMVYSAQDIDMSNGQVVGQKIYENVDLIPGKLLSSEASVKNILDVPLYVLGNNEQPELKVLPDGKGTEVPLDATIYMIAFNANGGTVNPSYAITDSSGKLANLPTPTLTDYKFNGWFTAANSGTRITTETVFSSDTTIYAQWTKNSTNPGGTVSPGTPTYNPGGTYVPPTYNITPPNVSGGKISINPTSASSGSIVTITTVPDAGYKLTSLTASDANGKNLELSSKAENQYMFKMPSSKVTIAAQFQPINGDTPWQNPFTDVSETDWYFDAVKFVNRNGLMNGVGNGSFTPNVHLSRAMFAQILYNKAGQPSIINSNVFSDVPDGTWFTDAVAWGVANSIVNGYNGQFNPDDPITREQLVLMLWRYEGQPTTSSTLLNFTDAANVSDYALSAMCWAVEKGIIKGKGNGVLDPQGFATRAESAQVLKNYLEN